MILLREFEQQVYKLAIFMFRINAICAFILILPCLVFCQLNTDKLDNQFGINFNYKTGFGKYHFDNISVRNKQHAFDFQVSYLFLQINKKVDLGFGIGIAGYHVPTGNTIPLEIKSRIAPLVNKKMLTIDLEVGYALPLGETFQQGITTSLGLTWSPPITKKQRIGLMFGYTLQEIKDDKLILFYPGGVTSIYDDTVGNFLYFGLYYTIW